MKAIIFSAGLGIRFKPWTDSYPKALALVNGKSLLQRNIEYLQRYGIKKVIVNVHHFADQVEETIKKNNGWGSHVVISDERSELLETGGGLLKAKQYFNPGEKFITCNVDILTDLDINKLISFHEQHKALISLGITNRKTSRYLLFDRSSRLCGWRDTSKKIEKVIIAQNNLVEMAYSCVVVFEYDVFSLIEESGSEASFPL